MRLIPKQVGRNILAQLYSQSVTLAVQFATVPILIYTWGIEQYGVWLLLTAIPAYLALSDLGFTFIAKNDMSIRVARGDRSGAVETFQSTLTALALLTTLIGFTVVAFVNHAAIGQWLSLNTVDATTAKQVLALQVASVLLYQFILLLCAGVRCEGRAATETSFAASSRLLEAALIVGAALYGKGLVGAAIAALSSRLICIVCLGFYLRISTPWLTFGFRSATLHRLMSLLSPSLSYMLVPISNSLLIQGPLIILGAVSSPATVALFSVTRTVARLGMAGANLLNYSFTPEYSFTYGRGDFWSFNRHLVLHAKCMLIGVVLYTGIMFIVAHEGVELLSHGTIEAAGLLTCILVGGVVLEMIWSGLFSPLTALNAHKSTACVLAACSCAGLAIGVTDPTVEKLALITLGINAVVAVFVSFLFARVLVMRKPLEV